MLLCNFFNFFIYYKVRLTSLYKIKITLVLIFQNTCVAPAQKTSAVKNKVKFNTHITITYNYI